MRSKCATNVPQSSQHKPVSGGTARSGKVVFMWESLIGRGAKNAFESLSRSFKGGITTALDGGCVGCATCAPQSFGGFA